MSNALIDAAAEFSPAFADAKAAAELALLHGSSSLTTLLRARIDNGLSRAVGSRAIDDLMAGNAAIHEGLKHYLNAQRRLAATRDELQLTERMVGDWSDCPPPKPSAQHNVTPLHRVA